MTLETAFQQLITENTDWHKKTAMSATEGEVFYDAFMKSGTNSDEVQNILITAGYFQGEIWSKNPSLSTQQVAPKTGIVDDGLHIK
jgi:hypothetical protein